MPFASAGAAVAKAAERAMAMTEKNFILATRDAGIILSVKTS